MEISDFFLRKGYVLKNKYFFRILTLTQRFADARGSRSSRAACTNDIQMHYFFHCCLFSFTNLGYVGDWFYFGNLSSIKHINLNPTHQNSALSRRFLREIPPSNFVFTAIDLSCFCRHRPCCALT
jgi:hypothetical protein